ncbi:MAG: LptF/LptG family permease [Chthoniobacterales bacterium]|nr:LptF/LptG family permease [Chthoniobacterales bacterium]
MKILDRYLLLAIGVATAMGVALLSLVLVLGNVFKEMLDLLINHNMPLSIVFAFVAFLLPFSMTFTIPWGFLTALLLVFGRLSADNELIAMRAVGISFVRICRPVLWSACFLTAICLLINLEVAPRAEQAMMEDLYKIATNSPISLFQSDEVTDQFPDRRVYVGKREGETLKNLLVFELDGNHLAKVVFAKEGHLTFDKENARLLLKLQDAHFEERDASSPNDFSKIHQGIMMKSGVFPMSLKQLFQQKMRGRHLNSYRFGELLEGLKKETPQHLQLLVELNKRFSIAFAAIAFALIAVPLGITAHRKETSAGFALSIVIAFGYFFFIIIADTFRSNPNAHPIFLIWLPNILFTALGVFLFRKLMKK